VTAEQLQYVGYRKEGDVVRFYLRGREESVGWITVPVLPQLIGRPFDDLARGLIHSLRPSHVRVSPDTYVTTDAQCWRVTVYTDGKDGPITRVDQEVEVGLPPGIEHGHAFQVAFAKGGG
jgi:hypothetical protein